MKRNILSFSVVRRLRQSPIFAYLVAVLLCGVLAGSFTGMHIPQTDGSYVNDLARLVSSNAAGKMPTLRTVAVCLLGAYGWMLVALMLGAIIGRLLWIALLMAVRGFLLAFAAAAALVESGLWGIYISVVSIGMPAVFWLPAMLLLCTAVLDAGMAQDGKGYFAALKHNRGAVILCAVLLFGSVLWRLLAAPVLLRMFGA